MAYSMLADEVSVKTSGGKRLTEKCNSESEELHHLTFPHPKKL